MSIVSSSDVKLEQSPAKRPKIDFLQPGKLSDDREKILEMLSRSHSKNEVMVCVSSPSPCESKQTRFIGSRTPPPPRKFCEICRGMNCDHDTEECPDKEKGMGTHCSLCHGQCSNSEDEEHRKTHFYMVKLCEFCGVWGRHWFQDCPYLDPPERTSSDDGADHFLLAVTRGGKEEESSIPNQKNAVN